MVDTTHGQLGVNVAGRVAQGSKSAGGFATIHAPPTVEKIVPGWVVHVRHLCVSHGQHVAVRISPLPPPPHVKESKTALDSEFHAMVSGFHVLDSGLFVSGTWILDYNC